MKLKTFLFTTLGLFFVITLSAQNNVPKNYHADPKIYKNRVKAYEMYGKQVDSVKYDKHGYVTELNTYDMESGRIIGIKRHFYKNGLISRIEHYSRSTSAGLSTLMTVRENFTYDEQHRRLTLFETFMIDVNDTELIPKERFSYEYNDKQQLVHAFASAYTGPGWQRARTYTYVYNEDGSLKKATMNKPDQETLIESFEYFYDGNKRLIKQIRTYADETGKVTDVEEVPYKYDEHGNIIFFGTPDFPYTFGYDLNLKREETFLFGGTHVTHLPIIYCKNAVNLIGESDKVTYEKNTAIESAITIETMQNDLQVVALPGEWHVTTENFIGKTIRVLGINGELLHAESINANETRIATERLPQGVTCIVIVEEHMAKVQVQ